MRVLVAGYGSMGRRHAQNARALGHEVGVADVDDARAAQISTDGFPLVTTPTPVDALVIATPAATHAALLWAHRAAHVLVEKPLALSVADYWARSTGRTPHGRVGVAYNLRFHPHARALRAWVTGLAAPPVGASFWLNCDGRTWPGRNYADTLLECSHEIDLAQHLLGPLTVTYAACSAAGQTWDLLLRTAYAQVAIHVSTAATEGRYERYATVTTADGERAWWGWTAKRSFLLNADLTTDAREHSIETVYRDELEAFLTGGWTPGCTVPEALDVLRLCDAARGLAGVPA